VRFFVLMFFLARFAFADDATDFQFRDIAGDLRCPTCTGLSVLDSDAAFSKQIKDAVREQMAQGKSKDEILKFFVLRYGPWILRAPPSEGFNLIAWILPISILIFGPLIVWVAVWRRRKEVLNVSGVRSSEEIAKEFEAELSRRRGRA